MGGVRLIRWIVAKFLSDTLEQIMHPRLEALNARVAQLEGVNAAGITAWDDLKSKYDAAVVAVGSLEQQLQALREQVNAGQAPADLSADDIAAINDMADRIAAVSQRLSDARVVNDPAN